jgi:glycosyltransferase involved in cell wall biosynthesis
VTYDPAIHVALIEPVGGHGGMNHYDFGLGAGLQAAGVDVVLYTCDETDPAGATIPIERTFRGIFGSAPRPVRALRFVAGLLRSLRHARRRGARIAHFHLFHANTMEWCAVELARLAGLRLVVTAHDVESFSGDTVPGLAARIYCGADRIIVHNAASRAALEAAVRMPPGHVTVIPHGNYAALAAGAPDRAEARRRLGLPETAPVLLFFGQIKAVKGLDLLLEALPSVVTDFPDLRVVIAGRVWKDDFARYDALVQAGGLQGHTVAHIRYIPDERAADYYRAADLVVLPYRRIYQSGVLLMSMSLGRAALVSDLPGMLALVRDGETGFVFRNGDVADLARSLRRILSDPARLERVAAAGAQLAATEHDWARIGLTTRAVYEQVLSRG